MSKINNISSSATIHPTAIIAPSVIIEDLVKIGPYCHIEGNVTLKKSVKLHSHVCITGNTEIGSGTEIFPFASLGYQPQDLKYAGEESALIIGEHNVIREYVTMHPGTKHGLMKTVVGNNCLFMVGCHIAHDCIIGNNVIIANNAGLAGHVVLEDNVIIGGLSGIHQFVRIGKYSMIGGMTAVRESVTPYGVIVGPKGTLEGVNNVGMKRANFDRKDIEAAADVFKKIFFEQEGVMSERIEEAANFFSGSHVVQDILDFIKNNNQRAICMPKDDKNFRR
ncbi:MAG: acyl-ACP--UDP-N-acetylglucosamine O-acyltransferase [Candidatus Midichloria sp.]|nr:acyl-ACP--UDP-N-acetylglucosamine O-acyltransferase [Candidatus Midichloria sp.]